MADCEIAEDFQPQVVYDRHGDTIEAIWEDATFLGEAIHPDVVLYRERETGRVVGVLIDGVEALRRKFITEQPAPTPGP